MQKKTRNHCTKFSKHKPIEIKHKNDRERNDGIRKPESDRGDRA